jgi:alkylhydroperoxidase family enzyme
MAFIRTISPRVATGELREAYLQIRRDMVGQRPVLLGMAVWNIMRVFSLRPAFLRAFERAFQFTMWGGVLDRKMKEAIGVAVSRTNQCHY